MSFEKFNPFNKNTENRYTGERRKAGKQEEEQKEENEDDFDPSRREFLKKSAVLAGSMAMSGTLGKLMKEATREQESGKAEKDPEPDKEVPASQGEKALPEKPTEEQEKIEQENVTSLSEVLNYDKEGKIELTPATMESIKNHWKKKYREDHKLRKSLEDAYKEIGRWESKLRTQFQKQGVPEKFVYLAIPESHWQLQARSGAGAVGPYQFMPKTGQAYGLKMDYFANHPRNLDERQDPIKAGDACARLLKDLHQAGGGKKMIEADDQSKDKNKKKLDDEAWSLALSGYNGGYFWHYLKNAQKNKEEISYGNFLTYMENKINKIKEDLKSNNYDQYEIKPGENINKIADKFNIRTEDLCRLNDIKNKNKVYAGQTIKIPISEETKKGVFENKIKGMAENLNYPAKFDAIHELIEEGFVQEQEEPTPFSTEKIRSQPYKHIFQKEDKNIYQISRNQKVNYKEILRANPQIKDPTKLNGGEELIIPGKHTQPTLRSIAEQKNKDLSELTSLNPAIKDPEAPIPKEYKVRI